MKKSKEIERDELGFIPSDYDDMQKVADKSGIVGDSLIGGFDITAEQIKLINGNNRVLRGIAVNCFYFVNIRLLRKMAYSFLRQNVYFVQIVEIEDLLHQLYVDLFGGYVKFELDVKQIRTAIYRCFKFTAVGGLEVLENVG